jgi:hypothetical protein
MEWGTFFHAPQDSGMAQVAGPLPRVVFSFAFPIHVASRKFHLHSQHKLETRKGIQMNRFTKAFVAATIISTTTLAAFGTAQAADSKSVATDRPCTYEGRSFPSGSAVKTGDGHTLYCLDGDWVSTGPQKPGGKPPSAPTSPLGVLVYLFAR